MIVLDTVTNIKTMAETAHDKFVTSLNDSIRFIVDKAPIVPVMAVLSYGQISIRMGNNFMPPDIRIVIDSTSFNIWTSLLLICDFGWKLFGIHFIHFK
jgi:hypothetical protein